MQRKCERCGWGKMSETGALCTLVLVNSLVNTYRPNLINNFLQTTQNFSVSRTELTRLISQLEVTRDNFSTRHAARTAPHDLLVNRLDDGNNREDHQNDGPNQPYNRDDDGPDGIGNAD
jgi:hypothetical protein